MGRKFLWVSRSGLRRPIHMKRIILVALALVASASITCAQTKAGNTTPPLNHTPITVSVKEPIKNPAIDMNGYLAIAADAAKYRESRRLTEDEFIRMSQEPGTIVLDARSAQKYNQ